MSITWVSGEAAAQDSTAAAPTRPAQPAAAPAPSAAEKKHRPVPTDPRGIRGISPAWQAIGRGDASFLAKDYPAAVREFQTAVKADPKHAMAHYRLGEAFRAAGDLKGALESFDSAGRFAGDPRMQAKALFVRAETLERLKKFDEAKAAWEKYAAFTEIEHKTPVVGYPISADERVAKVEAAAKLDADHKAVRDRIAARKAEKEAEAQKKPGES